MNMLQSFMGCMCPGSIRTESIESMDHDHPDCRFEVTNIDERGNEVSRGELQLTDRHLVYFRPSRFPTRWRIDFIRRYGYAEHNKIFLFESGRRCRATGEAIFAFRLNQAAELVERLKERIDRFPKYEISTENDQSDDGASSYRLGVLIPSSQQQQQSNKMPNTPLNKNNGSCHKKVPQLVQNCSTEFLRHRKRDVSTSTNNMKIVQPDLMVVGDNHQDADPRSLSYALIDFDITKALNESAQAHAASRLQ